MSSILTNNSAMNALSTLRGINKGLNQTQDRISSGLKIQSAKDNASYFAISKTMDSDSGMNKAINESLTLTKNAVSAGRASAEAVMEMTKEIGTKIAFASGQMASDPNYDTKKVQGEIDEIVARIGTTIEQATFNGISFVDSDEDKVDGTGTAKTVNIATGITRAGTSISTTSMSVSKVDLGSIKEALGRIKLDLETDGADNTQYDALTKQTRNNDDEIAQMGSVFIKGQMAFGQEEGDKANAADATIKPTGDLDGTTNAALQAGAADKMAFFLEVVDKATTMAIDAATSLGISEKSIETQQDFLTKLTDRLDSGIGSMVDADMEEEAARLQALQVQQQLASQSLSIANQAPQQILSLFR
ncbi:flagellin [Limimaricola variabilis]|uniref:Flagellin n=1 Tax=Limimaricola variabilis TaxID=1492771 RepID=A0ABR6HSF1_9RHOB|nr:flagellin [Limimaricola variabilis]MBB3713476.1 flagellin [Limimaricola variabilis]